ncbi:MAG TPA: SDR family oxidoreductase, partial [Chloroflexia bacterium]|nr:SDR family oxidoreductase [Chloroflexia bacterium]
GVEYVQITRDQGAGFWTGVADWAAAQGYSGALTYAANWGWGDDAEFRRLAPLWQHPRVGYIGIDAYYNLWPVALPNAARQYGWAPAPNSPEANPTVGQIAAGWTTARTWPDGSQVDVPPLDALAGVSRAAGKPILFTEVGYPNRTVAHWEPGRDPNSDEINNPAAHIDDPRQTGCLQERCFEAFRQIWGPRSDFAGYFWWDASLDPTQDPSKVVTHNILVPSTSPTSFYAATRLEARLFRDFPGTAAARDLSPDPGARDLAPDGGPLEPAPAGGPTPAAAPASSALTGKVALVTGAAAGIGRASALAFANAGARVVVSDVDAAGGAETVRQIQAAGGVALFVAADVAQPAAVAALIAQAVATYGRLDYAHNNAGIEGGHSPTAEYPEDIWDRVIAINLKGVWLCMKYEIAQMLTQGGGAIVNTASVAGVSGFPRHAAYAASKHGVVGLTKTAAREYASAGIRINAVCPGFIKTAMLDREVAGNTTREGRLRAAVPLGRLGTADEVAAAVVWLCTGGATFVTGQTLVLDGGMLA